MKSDLVKGPPPKMLVAVVPACVGPYTDAEAWDIKSVGFKKYSEF